MVASPPTACVVTVSGINGSVPVCKKISFDIGASNTEEQFFDVSNNNPNGSYSGVMIDLNGTPSLIVKLYDAQNNKIAEKRRDVIQTPVV